MLEPIAMPFDGRSENQGPAPWGGVKTRGSVKRTVPEAIGAKMRTAYTDPGKARRGDPGHPIQSGCVVYTYHGKFNAEEQPQILADCESGALGCVDCKKRLSAKVSDAFAEFRAKRAALVAEPDRVWGHLEAGAKKARAVARTTMAEVHEGLGF